MEFHGTPTENPWNSMELQLKIHGIPWHYVELHGTTWHSMELHGYSMEIHGTPWNSKELHEYFMELHGIPWISIEFHGDISHGLRPAVYVSDTLRQCAF